MERPTKPKLLDLFCCQGGAAAGYVAAGFDVTGVDIADHSKRYPGAFIQGDAIAYLAEHGDEYDAIHASPPCQAYTNCQKIQGNIHPELVEPTRDLLHAIGKPWIIENVEGAPLLDPVMLCGAMFGIETYRHRLFESNTKLAAPEHPEHVARNTKMGRIPVAGEFMHVVGNFSGVARAREVMGMPWATRDGLREAIPPAYTEFLGRQLIANLADQEAAA